MFYLSMIYFYFTLKIPLLHMLELNFALSCLFTDQSFSSFRNSHLDVTSFQNMHDTYIWSSYFMKRYEGLKC